jgi:hypothetical protein
MENDAAYHLERKEKIEQLVHTLVECHLKKESLAATHDSSDSINEFSENKLKPAEYTYATRKLLENKKLPLSEKVSVLKELESHFSDKNREKQ